VVIAPRPADVARALEHQEVVRARALEPDRCAKARKAAADDRHVHVAAGLLCYRARRHVWGMLAHGNVE
jgi:hypothetical protein